MVFFQKVCFFLFFCSELLFSIFYVSYAIQRDLKAWVKPFFEIGTIIVSILLIRSNFPKVIQWGSRKWWCWTEVAGSGITWLTIMHLWHRWIPFSPPSLSKCLSFNVFAQINCNLHDYCRILSWDFLSLPSTSPVYTFCPTIGFFWTTL